MAQSPGPGTLWWSRRDTFLRGTMDVDSFSHGPVHSKIWLCEQLEHFIKPGADIIILGGWHNVLGFLLLSRRPAAYKSITNIDKDPVVIDTANKICNAWTVNSNIVTNKVGDGNKETLTITPSSVVINCSVEHFENTDWFAALPKGTLVCIQSCDITDSNPPWCIYDPNPSLDVFLDKFPLSDKFFCGTKRIQYDHFGYNRFMLIGYT